MFAEFTYKEGVYVSDSLRVPYEDMTIETKISIKDGVIYEFNLEIVDTTATFIYSAVFSNINSVTVTAPAQAREAIDAEKAKG